MIYYFYGIVFACFALMLVLCLLGNLFGFITGVNLIIYSLCALLPVLLIGFFVISTCEIKRYLKVLCNMQYDFNKKFIFKDSTSNLNEK